MFAAVTEALMAPAQFPHCSGTRNLHESLSDLRAQVAANQKVCWHTALGYSLRTLVCFSLHDYDGRMGGAFTGICVSVCLSAGYLENRRN